MRMKVSELKNNYRLIEDVKGLTNRPIVPKNTIITAEIIDVLKTFLIKEVNVDPVTAKKEKAVIQEKENGSEIVKIEPVKIAVNVQSFEYQYKQAIEQFKKEYSRWQSGLTVEINNIRAFLIPLLDFLEKEPNNLLMLQNFVEKKDYVYHHAVGVGLISGYVASKLNLSKGDSIQVALAGCICDCGMTRIDQRILNKSYLNDHDIEQIRQHPLVSLKMVQNIPSLKNDAKQAVLQHHERLNGSGYPMGAEGQAINLYARIIAVADVYHAIVSDRVYRDKVSPFKAIETLNYDQFGHYDLSVLKTLTSIITQFAINTLVKLSNGQTAKILFINQNNPTRPVVQIIDNNIVLSLEEKKDLHIKEIY